LIDPSLLFSPPRLLTKTERRVNIHPKSVNANERFFSSPWFVYHLKLKTLQVSFSVTLTLITEVYAMAVNTFESRYDECLHILNLPKLEIHRSQYDLI